MGRPSIFSQALADDICSRISIGISLRSICRCEDMPCIETVWRWKQSNEEFCKQYAHARQEQADFLSEECLTIADEATPENAAVARLRVDTRKWYAGKMHPRAYGDKPADVTISNAIHNHFHISEEMLTRIQERRQQLLTGATR